MHTAYVEQARVPRQIPSVCDERACGQLHASFGTFEQQSPCRICRRFFCELFVGTDASPTYVFHLPTQYTALDGILSAYPRQSGPVFHAYNDLKHAAKWETLRGVDLRADEPSGGKISQVGINTGSGWAALVGRRPDGVSVTASV